ncbi:hypothetical protein [Marinobacterium stanieri]|uniref:hypothetical protein n=1 Tax=Marinobacterium stanieri TaxID=49186 RepID=UPI003A928216
MGYVWINLLYALLAMAGLFAMLRALDWLMGERFKTEQLPIIKQDPMALALYRGAWVIGGAVLIGSMLGV